MTACSNKRGKAGRVITAALVGALSVGAPAVALATTGGVEMMTDYTNKSDAWNKGTFEYSVAKDIDGNYVTEVGKYMTVKNVYSVFDPSTPLPLSDYTVLYFQDASTAVSSAAGDGVVAQEDKLTDPTTDATVSGRSGGVPNKAGHYIVAVVKGDVSIDLDETTTFADLVADAGAEAIHTQGFEIKAVSKDFSDVAAYEYNSTATDKGLSDTSLTFDGGNLSVGVSLGGKALGNGAVSRVALVNGPRNARVQLDTGAASAGYEVITVSSSSGYALAGTYTVRLTGEGDYAGKSVDLTFTVGKLDLSKAVLSVEPVSTSTGFGYTQATKAMTISLKADGNPLASSVYTATLNAVDGDQSAVSGVTESTVKTAGVYTAKVDAAAGMGDNVTGGPVLVDVVVANETVTYYYSGSVITTMPTFLPSANFSFNPSNLTAKTTTSGTAVPFTYKVTRDGQEVTSYDEPGEYVLELTTEPDSKCSYAGHATYKFTVQGETVDYGTVTMFVAVDGKDVTTTKKATYTGSAIEPVVALTNKSGVLEEGTDYTLEVTDEDGEVVDSILMPGTYTITATLADTAKTEMTFDLTVDKANILSAEAAADFYALGSTPAFVGSTNKTFDDGTKFDLASDQISVVCKKAEKNSSGKWVAVSGAKALDLDEIDEPGDYVASVNVLTDCETLTGSAADVHVVFSEFAAFEDVDAGAWYADVVYKASDLNYMKGVGGTKLFMPEAKISRAEMACTMFNLAGQTGSAGVENWPTRFEDVVSNTWYSQAVSWASEAGVMNGNGNVFGINDYTNREQVAAIFYNYAKAQGKDVSVKDADAALAAYADGSQVSDWAKVAVAWAVENGVMGNGELLAPQSTITRAEMAAMAVNFQPEALK